MSDSDLPAAPDPTSSAFRHRGFLYYWLARFLATFATQIVCVAVGWQVYDLTRDPFDLGIVGLVQFLPSLLLVLVTGRGRRPLQPPPHHGALPAARSGRLPRRCWSSPARGMHDRLADLCDARRLRRGARLHRAGVAVARCPISCRRRTSRNAIAWNSSSWQIATIVGPVAGGLLYGLSEYAAYGTALGTDAAWRRCSSS